MIRLFFVLFILVTTFVSSPLLYAEELSAKELTDTGVKYFNSGEFDKAIEYYEKALAKATDNNLKADLFFNLSSAYLEKGIVAYWENKDNSYYIKSIEYAKKCLDIIPYYWKALANVATVYMNMNELEKADFYYTEAEKYLDVNSPYCKQLFDQHSMAIGALKLRGMQEDKEEEK